ncbi:MAG: DUF2087 domain-containing protein [Clostridia bacterium]|nr:DUF2087 domain-containing protein [Clostridia bacterium]
MKEKLEILKLLADKTRLDILNALMKEDSYVEKIACDLSITPATICYHLKKMESVGMVKCSRSQFYMIYSLNKEIFDKPLIELVKNDTPLENSEDKYRKEVISNFFKLGKLISIPTQRKKREIVLAEISKSFKKGKIYAEKEVDEIIHKFHEDHCTIRREMIGCGLMKRENGKYWII